MSRTNKDKPWRIHKAVPEFSVRAWFGDGPKPWIKRVWHGSDRMKARQELRKEEPQIMANHRHYGSWRWY